ncbi:MAG: polysaccharide deacetylase family protein [Bacteroidales bacterium]|nr:polysaccharide deacetylase family protein [Bacteroidales bacterium]
MEPGDEIYILCSPVTARIQYTARFLSDSLGTDFTVAQSPDRLNPNGVNRPNVIHYGDVPVLGEFNIFASGLCSETAIREFEPAILRTDRQTMLFPAPEGFDLPFDLFSAVFYLIARYEEYLPFKADEHGRFEADQSLAFREGFLEEPVVDQWIEMLKTALVKKYPGLKPINRNFRYESTFDVDNPWAYRHKGFFRTAGGFIKNMLQLNYTEFRLRLDVLRGKSQDPYDAYDYILEKERQYGFLSCFFFLSGGYDRYDSNYALGTPAFKNLLKRLKPGRTIGIHPSYRSNRSMELLQFEVERFSRFLGSRAEASRQHYLILRFPETYRRLMKMGLKEDHSMGYASGIGFRAGTSRPFRFYDLKFERETNLIVHPFIVMDVTLQQYLGLKPDEALNRISAIVKKIKAVNGIFTSLWHNESLSEAGIWLGWRRVYEEMIKITLQGSIDP